MDENVLASETQNFAPKDCFDLKEPLQEGIISILFVIYILFIIEYDVDFLSSCFNIAPKLI